MPMTVELFKAEWRATNLWPKDSGMKQQKRRDEGAPKSQSLAVSVSNYRGPKAILGISYIHTHTCVYVCEYATLSLSVISNAALKAGTKCQRTYLNFNIR